MVSAAVRRVLTVVTVVVIGLCGAVALAEPGDRLWPVTRVLAPGHARVVEQSRSSAPAQVAAVEALAQARDALSAGELERARWALARVQWLLPQLGYRSDRVSVAGVHARLSAELAAATAAGGGR